MQPHIRTDFARKVFDLFAFGVIFKLAGQDQVNLPLRAFVGGLQPAKHRQRIGLGGGRKSAQKQRCDGVPTLQRGCCKCSDRFHHRVTGGRVGDAAQAPPALIVSPAQPRMIGNCRARVLETADLREFFRCVERDSPRAFQRSIGVPSGGADCLREGFGGLAIRCHTSQIAPADCRPIRRRPDIL